MRPLRVNFASRRHVRPVFGYGLAVSLFAFAWFQGMAGFEAQRGAEALEAQVREVHRAAEQRAASAQASTQPRPNPPYLRDALAVAQMADWDVGRVLTALEAVRVVGVRVLAIELVPGDKLARVDLELTEAGTLTQYLDELNAGLDAAQRWRLHRFQAPSGSAAGLAVIVADPALGRW